MNDIGSVLNVVPPVVQSLLSVISSNAVTLILDAVPKILDSRLPLLNGDYISQLVR